MEIHGPIFKVVEEDGKSKKDRNMPPLQYHHGNESCEANRGGQILSSFALKDNDREYTEVNVWQYGEYNSIAEGELFLTKNDNDGYLVRCNNFIQKNVEEKRGYGHEKRTTKENEKVKINEKKFLEAKENWQRENDSSILMIKRKEFVHFEEEENDG